MSENEKTKAVGEVAFKASQHEDAALKTAMHFFAEELLPFWGIEGKVVGFAPTEQVHLEIQKLYQDTNLIMEDGSWKHFEFQSKNEGLAGLKRFRQYEATASRQYGVSVITYVLFSGKIQNPMTEFTEGINTYRIIPIIMKKENADIFLKELLEKKNAEKPITREELVRLTLCPLMGGEIGIKQRLQIACEITRGETAVTKEEIQKIEAVIYAMADKFLDGLDMEEFVEGMKMTRLGEMLVKEGKQEGMNEKETEIIKNLLGILDDEVLMERLHISKERLEEVKDQK
ncbi:MAG: hypothetical protein UHO63_03015 [Blautia sp.]|nr:hypothetical protein [Blautia sp.]